MMHLQVIIIDMVDEMDSIAVLSPAAIFNLYSVDWTMNTKLLIKTILWNNFNTT